MSFVGKAIKKVFKKAKKFVKRLWDNKWVRIAILIAATVFTAGLAAGGWAYVAGSGVSGFFSSVGATFAKGWATIASGAKSFFGVGGSTKTAADATLVGEAASGVGSATGGAGAGASVTAAGSTTSAGTTIAAKTVTNATVSSAALGGSQAATQGLFGQSVKWLFGSTKGAAAVRTAVGYGAMSYMQRKAYEEDRANVTIAGGRAFGGSASATRGPLFFEAGASNEAGSRARQSLFGEVSAQSPEEFAQRATSRTGDQVGGQGFAKYAPNFENANATQIAPTYQGLAAARGT